MAVTQDTRQQLHKIDEQIIHLLAQRVITCQKILEEDEQGLDSTYVAETVGHWEEEAEERGLNIGLMGQMSKLAVRLCQVAAEE